MRAIEDRCAHRSVRFSARPLFYTQETLTGWYHTRTFDIESGVRRAILSSPDSKMNGRQSA
jgi:carbazole 1,9a-dioxygenase terminal dioxygenase component